MPRMTAASNPARHVRFADGASRQALWRPPASGPVRSPASRCAAASWRPAHRPAPFAGSGCRPVRSPPLSVSQCGSPAASRRGLAAPPASLTRGSASRSPAGRGSRCALRRLDSAILFPSKAASRSPSIRSPSFSRHHRR